MLPTFRRTILAELRNFRRLHHDLVAFLESGEVPAKASHDAQVVCEELVVNAIHHGLGAATGADHRIELIVTLGDSIAIRIRDDLRLFDPTSFPPPPHAASIADVPVGGRGIAMVKRMAKSFRWHEERGGNVIDVEIPLAPSQEIR
jgi:anti-sigma regulatory factor (Ser/Thr protein kinase)